MEDGQVYRYLETNDFERMQRAITDATGEGWKLVSYYTVDVEPPSSRTRYGAVLTRSAGE